MNPKKLTFLLVAICICCITNAQSIGLGLGGNMVVNTEGGNRLELSFYNDKGEAKVPFSKILIRYTDSWIASHPEDFKGE